MNNPSDRVEEEVVVEEGDRKICSVHFNSDVIIWSRNCVVYSKIQLHFFQQKYKMPKMEVRHL